MFAPQMMGIRTRIPAFVQCELLTHESSPCPYLFWRVGWGELAGSHVDSSVLHNWKWPWVSDPPAPTSKVWIADFYLFSSCGTVTQTQDFWDVSQVLYRATFPVQMQGYLVLPSCMSCMNCHVHARVETRGWFQLFPLISFYLVILFIYLFLRQGLWMHLKLTNLARPVSPSTMHCKGLPMSILPVLRLHTHPSFHLRAARRSWLLPATTTLLTKLSAQSPETDFLIHDFILLSKM